MCGHLLFPFIHLAECPFFVDKNLWEGVQYRKNSRKGVIKMKKKGFTLIELLAVIVVLAIIALIATPIVLNLINNAKKGAAEQSASIYIKEIENYMILNQLNPKQYPLKLESGKSYQLTEEVYSDIAININKLIPVVYADKKEIETEKDMYVGDYIYVSGTYPESGIITIGENNTIESASMDISGYVVDCNEIQCNAIGKSKSGIIRVKEIKITDKSVTELMEGDTLALTAKILPDNATNKDIAWLSSNPEVATVENGFVTAHKEGNVTIVAKSGSKTDSMILNIKKMLTGPTKVEPTDTDTHKGIVYLDPKNINKYCDASNSISKTGMKEGCMKWYIYIEDNDNYTMILDHNTSVKASWNSRSTQLKNDTDGWDEHLTSKIITANEIATITDNKSWRISDMWYYFDSKNFTNHADSTNKSKYAWLFDYTNDCEEYGCNIGDLANSDNYGYLTNSSYQDSYNGKRQTNIRMVSRNGSIAKTSFYSGDYTAYGLRPVITVSKSIIDK